MKKIYSVTLILVSIMSSLLCLIHFDKEQQKSLLLHNIKEYNYSVMIENFDSIEYDFECRKIWDDLATKHGVYVFLSQYGYEDNTVKFLFSSNAQTLVERNLKIGENSLLPYTTTGDSANVSDILHNDKFIYDLMSSPEVSSFYWNGTMNISFDNLEDFESFILDFSDKNSISVDSINSTVRSYRETDQLLNASLISSSVILLIVFILTIIQRINTHSTRIGVLLLNGYDYVGVLKVLFGSDYILVVASCLVSLLTLLILPDVTQIVFVSIVLKDLILITIVYLLYYLFVSIILKTKSIYTLLKKNRISSRLSQINLYFQITISVVIFLLFLLSTGFINKNINNNNQLKDFDYLLNYGTIYRVNSEFLQNHGNLSRDVFQKVKENELLREKYIYANFDKYSVYGDDVIVQEGYDYDDLYATVSKGFLVQENINVKDGESRTVNVDDYDSKQDIFIFPENYSKDEEKLLKYYYSNNIDFFQNQSNFEPIILYYSNKSIKTYNLDVLEIDSPVLKIVRDDEYRSYTSDPEGLSVYGIGLNTGLKFDVSEDKEMLLENLEKIFDDLGYNDALVETSFVTISDYFNADLARNFNAIKIMLIAIAAISVVLIFSQVQFVSLYIIQNDREISVKRYLGFEVNDIYKELYTIESYGFLISFILSTAVNFFLHIGIWSIFFGFVAIFGVLNIVSMVIIINLSNKKRIINSLKGGNG